MSSGDVINANPTVLDASQLPTREESATAIIKSESLGKQEELSYYDQLYQFTLLNSSLIYGENNHLNFTLPNLVSDNDMLSFSTNLKGTVLNKSNSTKTETETAIVTPKEDEEAIDAQEIYDLISTISDPEHPLTLGQLAVVNLNDIKIQNNSDHNQISEITIYITPTITHCSLATLIGLGIKVRLERCLPKRFRVTILLKEGSHQSENQVNKQLNDKERVSAACENEQLLKVIGHMLSTCQ